MKVSCSTTELARALSVVRRAVDTRTRLPVRQSVLIATSQSMVKVSASGSDLSISVWLDAAVEEDGSIAVPIRLLAGLVDSLPAGRVDLVVPVSPDQTILLDKGIARAMGPRSLYLYSSRSHNVIRSFDATEFPFIPTVGDGLRAKIEPGQLKAAISQVVFAVATEDSRPVLTGVKLELAGDRFTMVAADGYRLAVHKGQLVEPLEQPDSPIQSGPIGIILPARTMNELNRLMGDQDGPVEIAMNPARGQVQFNLKGIEVVSQLIQGTFPNYSQLIPQSYQTWTAFNLQELMRAVRTASVFDQGDIGIIRLQMTHSSNEYEGGQECPGKMTVIARSDVEGDSRDEIDVTMSGSPSKIAFNPQYLMNMLSVMDCEQVILETNSPSEPGVFRSRDSDIATWVLMPLFIQW